MKIWIGIREENSRRESLVCVTHGLLLSGMCKCYLCTILPVNIPHSLITQRPFQSTPLKEKYAPNEGNIPNYYGPDVKHA